MQNNRNKIYKKLDNNYIYHKDDFSFIFIFGYPFIGYLIGIYYYPWTTESIYFCWLICSVMVFFVSWLHNEYLNIIAFHSEYDRSINMYKALEFREKKSVISRISLFCIGYCVGAMNHQNFYIT